MYQFQVYNFLLKFWEIDKFSVYWVQDIILYWQAVERHAGLGMYTAVAYLYILWVDKTPMKFGMTLILYGMFDIFFTPSMRVE